MLCRSLDEAISWLHMEHILFVSAYNTLESDNIIKNVNDLEKLTQNPD